ncbi:MAG: hypothetical protein WCQ53_05135 [bacterium]
MTKTFYTLFAVITVLCCSSIQAQGFSNFSEVKATACRYLGYDPLTNKEGLSALIEKVDNKFLEKSDGPIDKEDLNMLYGDNDGEGVLDYFMYINKMKKAQRPTLFEIAARRFLGNKLKDIYKKTTIKELINGCLYMFGSETGVLPGYIPMIVDDGFLKEAIKLIKETTDLEEREKLSLRVKEVIEMTAALNMSTDRKRKLNSLEIEYNRFIEDLADAEISEAEVRNYLLDTYFNGKDDYKSKTTDELMDEAVSIAIAKETSLGNVDVEMLIGKGSTYYYLAQKAESLSEDDAMKTERMAQVFLLGSYLEDNGKLRFYVADIYQRRWDTFNLFFANHSWPFDEKALPERYLQQIKNIKGVTKK